MKYDPTQVFVASLAPAYPTSPPFHPGEAFPEWPSCAQGAAPNEVFRAVRELLAASGLDRARLDTADWNPLGEVLRPGGTVLLKPNMVKESHPRDPDGWTYVVTHGSVIRAVADYAFKAVGPTGRIIIADAPQTDSSFSAVSRLIGLHEIADHLRRQGATVDVVDLRREEWTNEGGVIVERRHLPGDPLGNVAFDLGERSEFVGHRGSGQYYGADYASEVVNSHHSEGRHEYLLAGSAVKCDAVISLPKLKTHKKAGITVSLKNLIGINGDKNWLPHHTEGSPRRGGDERPHRSMKSVLERTVVRILRRAALAFPKAGARLFQKLRASGTNLAGATETTIRSGNWSGNDTLWRTCLDLNKIVLYGNPDGTFREADVGQQRPHLVFVDGVIAGEGNGPMDPDPVAAGLMLFGFHPASTDAACAAVMGFEPQRIPIVRQAFLCRFLPLTNWALSDVALSTTTEPGRRHPIGALPAELIHCFKPHFGWVGEVEARAK